MKINKITLHCDDSEPLNITLGVNHTQLIGSNTFNHETIYVNSLPYDQSYDDMIYLISLPDGRVAEEIKKAIDHIMLKYRMK